MAGYYFIKSNGHLYRLTNKAYQTWVIDSANRLSQKHTAAKLRNYGTDLGEVSNIISASDVGFETLSIIYSGLDSKTNT
jgi:hypothetical protein